MVDPNTKMVFVFVKERNDGLADVWFSTKNVTPSELEQIIAQVEQQHFLSSLRLKNVRCCVKHRSTSEPDGEKSGPTGVK